VCFFVNSLLRGVRLYKPENGSSPRASLACFIRPYYLRGCEHSLECDSVLVPLLQEPA